MSTSIIHTRVHTMAKLTTPEDKRLVRTSSLAKISTFICTQQYFMIPVLLHWIRSSQVSAEAAIHQVRSLFLHLAAALLQCLLGQLRSTAALRLAAYLVALICAAEAALCGCLLAHSSLPLGLLFLLGAFACIAHMAWGILSNMAAGTTMDKKAH